MKVHEAEVSYWHDCWMLYSTEKCRGVKLIVYKSMPIGKDDLSTFGYVHSSSKILLDKYVSTVKAHANVKDIRLKTLNRSWTKIYVTSSFDRSKFLRVLANGCFEKFWYAYDGLEGGVLVARDKKTFKGALNDLNKLGTANVLWEKEKDIDDLDIIEYVQSYGPELIEFLLSLSKKQLQALKFGIDLGYYDAQKRIGLKGLAKKLKVSTPTLNEHLLKSEHKLMPKLRNLLDMKEKYL